MNKSDVLDRVAGAAGVGRQQAESVIDAFFDTVRSAVKSGDRVGWPSFGNFSMTQRKARTGRNPRTGEAVKIKASKAVKFSSSSALKDAMNRGGASAKPAAKKGGGTKKGGTKKAAAVKKAPARAAKKAPARAATKSVARKAPATKTAKAKKATRAR